jgi:uncharacterized protein (TIGR00369 family)
MDRPAVTLEQINDFFISHVPFCTEMNIRCDHLDNDIAVARFTYDDRWTRPGSMVAGPVLMALADVAVYGAIFTRTGITPLAVTNELKMNFLRPAIGRDVLARARLLKVGRRIAYAAADVFEEHDEARLIAHATASYVLPDGTGLGR